MNNQQNKIETVDPLAPLYNINGYDETRLYRKGDVEAVNHLVKISHGAHSRVETEKDWMIVAKIFEFWTRRWPEEWTEFGESILAIKQTRGRKDGKSTSGEIKYVGALPLRFMKMLQIIFTEQQFDKKFVYKLINKIKIVRVGEKHDSWFLI